MTAKRTQETVPPIYMPEPADPDEELLLTMSEVGTASGNALYSLTRAWSALQVGEFQDAYKEIDRCETLLCDVSRAAHQCADDQLQIAARLCGRGGVPPWKVNAAAIPHLESICKRWLPEGSRQNSDWGATTAQGARVTVSLMHGSWTCQDLEVAGEDLIGLGAWLHGVSRADTLQNMARMLGLA